MNNIEIEKELSGVISTTTPFDLTLNSCPQKGYSEVKNNLGIVIYRKKLFGELLESHAANVRDFMQLASTADLRKPLN